MQNNFGRPTGLRNTFYNTPEDQVAAQQIANEVRVSDLNTLERGLRQGLHTTPAMLADAGSVYTEPVAPGLSNSLRNWATDQYRAAQGIPMPVSTWEEVEQNPLKIGSYAAGKLGQNLPQWGLVAPAAAVGALSAGPLGLGAMGAAVGGTLGAYGANVGMTSGEQARNFFEDPAIMANTTPEQRATEALKYGAAAGALDTVGDALFGSRLLGAGKALKAGVMPAVKHLAKTIPEAAVTEGLPELGQTALSQAQLGQLNSNRDTSGDASELKEAFFGGWAGGSGLTGAGRSVQVARANAEPVKEWLGETASSARNKLADMLRPSTLPPELNNASDEEVLAWDAQQKQQKQQVAEQLATEALNDPSSSQTLKQKAAQFFEDVRNGVTDAWQEFSKGVDAERAVQRAQDGFDRFSEAVRDRFTQRPGAAAAGVSEDVELSPDDQAILATMTQYLPKDFAERGDPVSLYRTLSDALTETDPDLPWNALVDAFGGEAKATIALTRMHEGLARMGKVKADPEFDTKVYGLLKAGNERDNTEHGRFVATLLPRYGNVDKQAALKTISDIKRGLRSYSDMPPDMRRQFDTRMTELFGDRANDYLNSLVTNDTRLELDGETEVDDDIWAVDGNQDPALQSIRETDGPSIRYVGSAQQRVDEGAKGSKQHGGFFNLAHPNEEVRGNIQRRMQAAKAEAKQRGMAVRELTPLDYARSAGINPNVIAEELGVKVEDLGKHPARILRIEDAPPGVLRDDPLDMNTEELNKLGATQTQKVLRPRASVDQSVADKVREALAKPTKGGERFKALNDLGYPHAVAVESVGGKNFVQMDMNYGGAGRFTVVKKDGTRLTMNAQDLIARQRKASSGQDPNAGPQGAADLQRQFASALSSILNNADVQGIEVRDAFGKVVTKQDDVMGAFGPFFQLMSTRDGNKVTLGQSNRKQVRGDKGRDAEKEFAGLDDEIAALEAELEDLTAELDTAGAKQARAIERRIEEVQSDLNELLEQKGDGYQNALAGEDTERAATTFEIAEGQALQEQKSPKARRFDEQTGEPLAQPANVGANAGKRGKLQSDIKSLEAEIKTLSSVKGVPAQNRRAKLQAELDAKRAELESLGGAVKPESKPAPVRPAPKSDPKDIDADIEDANRASRERDYSEAEQAEVQQQVEATVDEIVSEATEQAQEQGAKKSELDELAAVLSDLKKALVNAYGRTADVVSSAVATKALPARETVDAMVEALRTALRQFIEAAKVTGQKANDLRKLVQKKIAEAQRVRSEIETQRRIIEKIMSDARARIADRVARGDLGDPKALSDKEVSEWNEPEARGSMITSLRNVTPEEAIAFEELLRAVEPLGLPTEFKGFLLAGEGSTSGAAVNAPNKTLILSKRLYDALTKAGDNQAAKDRVVYRMAVHELVHMVDANGSRKVFGTPIKGATFTSTGNPRLQPKGDLYQEAQRLTRWPSTSAYFAYPLQYNLDESVVPSELVAQALSAYYTNPAALLKDSPLFYDFSKEIADGLVGQDRARVLQALSGVQSDGGNTPDGGTSADAGSGRGVAAGAAAGRRQRQGQRQAGGTRQAARQPSRHRSANVLKKLQALVETAQNTLIDSDNKALTALGRVFSNETGSKDRNISFLSARVQKTNEYLNQLVAALSGHEKITLNAAVKGLQTGSLAAPGTQVREVQDKVRKVLDDLFEYMRDAGVDVKKRKDYFPRTWDPLAIQDNLPEFLDQIMQDYQQVKGKRMDPKSAQAIADVLILNRGAEAVTESDYHVGYTPYMMSTNARKLDYLVSDYSRFQRSDMVDIMSTYISQAVHRAEYARRFGNDGAIIRAMLKDAYAEEIHRATGSTAAWDAAVKQAEQDEADLAQRENRQTNPDNVTIDKIKAYLTGAQDAVKQADEVIGRARKAIMAMEGTLGAQAEGKFKELLRRYTPAIIVYENFRLLWLSLFSQFIDPLGVMVRGGTAKGAFNAYVRGLRGVMHGWKGTEAEDSATQLARKLGVIDAANALNTMGNMYSATYIDGRAKKINDALFRWNGVEQFSQGVRVGATEAAISFIKFHLDKGNRHSERYLAELGLKKGDKFDIDDPKIRDAIFRWVDGATVRPNAALRPVWASDPHYALLFHMKQFTYAFHKVILERMITEAKHGNFDPAYVALAAYVPVMIAADVVRGFVGNGGDEPPWMRRADAGDIVMRGIERAGLLGIPQLGKDMIDWGPVEAGGPAIEQAAETVANLAGGDFNKAWRDALPAVNVIKDALDFK